MKYDTYIARPVGRIEGRERPSLGTFGAALNTIQKHGSGNRYTTNFFKTEALAIEFAERMAETTDWPFSIVGHSAIGVVAREVPKPIAVPKPYKFHRHSGVKSK